MTICPSSSQTKPVPDATRLSSSVNGLTEAERATTCTTEGAIRSNTVMIARSVSKRSPRGCTERADAAATHDNEADEARALATNTSKTARNRSGDWSCSCSLGTTCSLHRPRRWTGSTAPALMDPAGRDNAHHPLAPPAVNRASRFGRTALGWSPKIQHRLLPKPERQRGDGAAMPGKDDCHNGLCEHLKPGCC
jgi:hypothetical protein